MRSESGDEPSRINAIEGKPAFPGGLAGEAGVPGSVTTEGGPFQIRDR